MKHPSTKIIKLNQAIEWRQAMQRDGQHLAVARVDVWTYLCKLEELYALSRMADATAVLLDCSGPDHHGLIFACFGFVNVVIDTPETHAAVDAVATALKPEFYQDLRYGAKDAKTDPFIPAHFAPTIGQETAGSAAAHEAVRPPSPAAVTASEVGANQSQNGAPAGDNNTTGLIPLASAGDLERGLPPILTPVGAPILVDSSIRSIPSTSAAPAACRPPGGVA